MTSHVLNPEAGTMAEINITPFTDVLLVLLIIFMILAAIATPPGFQKSLQHGNGPVVYHVKQPIRVLVDDASRIFIDGTLVPPSNIYSAMSDAIASHAADSARFSEHIELIGSASAPYDTIIKVLDAGREAGDDDIGLVIGKTRR